MSDGAFNFANYAPQRPQLAWSQPDAPQQPGELAQVFAVIRNALALIRHCLGIAACIIWRRARAWVEDKVLYSLTSAWVLCGTGWGASIGLGVYLHLAR